MKKNIKIEVSYIPYWTIACILIGIIIAPFIITIPEDHSKHYNHEHMMMDHGQIEADTKSPPAISMSITKDAMSGWNLTLETENFEFTPSDVNQAHKPNQGHAHIYVNGLKLARLYSTNYHLSEFPEGEHEVVVTLNANNHAEYIMNGESISAKGKIIQNKKEEPVPDN